MKVVLLSTDRKIFEDTPVRQRMVEYGGLFERLDVVVINRGGKVFSVELSANVFAHSASSLWSAFKISSELKDGSIISTQDPFEVGIIGVLLKMRYKLPLQVQLHTDFNNIYFVKHSLFNFIRFFLAHAVLPYADAVRVVSKKVGDSIKDLNENITVLPINIEKSEIRKPKLETNSQKILTVARLEKEKDLETAIKAFAEISNKYPEATLTIAGEGSHKKSLQLLANSLKLGERVNFIGWVKDLDGLYGEHDIYVSTSLYEGYGMSVVEAGLRGLALVLSEAGVARELPAHVCKPGDTDSFVEALDKLLGDKALLEETQKNTALFVQSFILNKDEYLSRYKEAITKSIGVGRVGFIKALFVGNKVLRFLVGGGSAAFTQIFFLYVFTDILKLWYIYSSVFSFCLAFMVSFLMQKLWVFQDKEIKGSHVQLIKYIFVGLLGLGLNTILMYVFVSFLGLWYILSQVGAGILIAIFNFFVYRKFIFKQ